MSTEATHRQADIQARAAKVLPAGGFGNYAADIIVARGDGSQVWDEDGNRYVDLLIGSGPMLVGHSHPEVLEVVQEQLSIGQTFFANNRLGIELAEQIVHDMACAQKVRYVSTGGEADMYAMRLARAHTGREKILKFEGGYHGMSDHALMSLAPTQLTNYPLAVPDSAGILDHVRDTTIVAPWNAPETLTGLLDEYDGQIAGIIIEPLQRIIPPAPGWLEHVRAETAKRGIVLIFDEVVTGYRLAYGGAQEKYGVIPDLCTLGKVIGGGFPLAAIAGSDEIMAHFDKALVGPEGFTFQVGTLSGNPVAAAAGLKTMEILSRPGTYDRMRANGEAIMQAAQNAFEAAGVPIQITGDATLFELVFTDRPVVNYRNALQSNKAQEAVYNAAMRKSGILKPPGKIYTHLALTEDDLGQIEEGMKAAAEAVAAMPHH
ncbi:MAG: aminotransferase class III-fold pyridoxal phosphate-dependent enzyme [Pseudomonadota bacterium]